MPNTAAIVEHYSRGDLGEAILEALTAAGKDIDRLTPDDLAPIDEFHTGGRSATVGLAKLLAPAANDRVLDLGCGIGGPSRYLATTYGCRVVGLDLTPEFCRVAAMLAERTGVPSHVEFRQGDALSMPFGDQSFDVVWSQNVAMNIADRNRLYGEILRMLRPGGRYAFADVVAGPAGNPFYPMPWAHSPLSSHLLSADATRERMAAAGFRIEIFQDQTQDAIAQQRARARAVASKSPLGVHVILGPDTGTILANSVRSLLEGRIGLIQGIAVRMP